MFPWNYGFHWNVGSAVFLGAFYGVIAVVAATVHTALVRARRTVASGRSNEIRWRSEFSDLPAHSRPCRHTFTGELPNRRCRNAFDCRACETHASLTQGRVAATPAVRADEILGMRFPLDRMYDRGHTWVRPEPDGTVTVGLDELGRGLLGTPDRVELPKPGTRLHTHGTAWRVYKRNATVRIRSPLAGEVIAADDEQHGGRLRVKPLGKKFDFSHLLAPAEVNGWLVHEADRLQLTLSAEAAPTLADGGALVNDISGQYPRADWETVCAEMFLQS